jgi:glutamine amidotransferase
MTRRTIGIVDYKVSNLTSVWRALHSLGYRCRVSSEHDVLNETDLLLLPGVGAFPTAMEALHRYGLVEYLQTQARSGKPMLGICLGMQLMADLGTEHRHTAGLGMIPGKVQALGPGHWHIGWNTIEVVQDDPILRPSNGRSFYFNHSFAFEPAQEYRAGVARVGAEAPLRSAGALATDPFTIIVRRANTIGLQFHPEKSQAAGRQLLRDIVEGLCP